MNKLKNKLLTLLFAFVILFSTTCMATNVDEASIENTENNDNVANISSTNSQTSDNIEVISEEATTDTDDTTYSDIENSIYSSDYYNIGQSFNLNKLVDGNSFVMGETVNVTGQINGDLFILADTVTIDEDAIIYNNLFILANEVIVNGISYNIYALSNNFTLGSTASVYRDMRVFSNEITINGNVQRDVYLSTNTLNFAENSKDLIGGSLNYSSPNEQNIPEDAVVGEIQFEKKENSENTTTVVMNYIMKFIATAVFVLIVVLIIIFLAPKFIDKANYNLIKRPFISSGIGILGIVLIPFACILLMTITITLPISFTVLAIYGVLVALSFSVFAIALAKYFVDKLKLTKKWQFILFTELTAIVMYGLTIIPAIGTFMKIFFSVVGFGVIIMSLFSKKFEKTEQTK